MSARELRAEARAWRRAARAIDAMRVDGKITPTQAMRDREAQHEARNCWVDPRGEGEWLVTYLPWDQESRVLACLFLALECEDEAKEATRG